MYGGEDDSQTFFIVVAILAQEARRILILLPFGFNPGSQNLIQQPPHFKHILKIRLLQASHDVRGGFWLYSALEGT